MSDRELVEKAARAAGYDVYFWSDKCAFKEHPHGAFNPLVDDGCTLRLAVKLRLNISHSLFSVTAWIGGGELTGGIAAHEMVDEEARRDSATRRAIVRAAAAIHDAKGQ